MDVKSFSDGKVLVDYSESSETMSQVCHTNYAITLAFHRRSWACLISHLKSY